MEKIKIIQNFTNFKQNKCFRETELMIWTANLIQYHKFGYTVKLYCTPDAIPFLKEWNLFDLYDEIDDEYLNRKDSILKKVDETHFWSSRKLEALYHEYVELKTDVPVIYSDVDIIMLKPFNIEDCDCLFWSPEIWSPDEGDVYVDWGILSVPENYQMPHYIKENHEAYNCGIIYFKDADNFIKYRDHYYSFVLNNPCTFIAIEGKTYNFDKLRKENNVWACNAEQRILYGLVKHLELKVSCVMDEKADGRCAYGCHYFVYRICWKELEKYIIPPRGWVNALNETIFLALTILNDNNTDLYNFWNSRDWLRNRNFLKIYDPVMHIFPVKKYY